MGRKNDKLVFMYPAYDSELDLAHLAHNLNEGKRFFMEADDDSYVFMENLRYMLFLYNTDDSLYFGHRFTQPEALHGFMAASWTLIRFSEMKLSDKISGGRYFCQGKL